MSSRCLLFPSLVIASLAWSLTVLGAPLPPCAPLGMTFARLPKATFFMGWDGPNKPGKKTEIKDDFEIALHPVTQGQWQAVMGNNPSWFSRDGGGKERIKGFSDSDLKQFPVERVSWEDAQEFIKKLNERELPTEAGWEYACRGGATSEQECSYHFYFNQPTNDLSSVQANFIADYPDGDAPRGTYLERTTRVDTYPPNKLGLCDMHGNVWQWCQDEDASEGAAARVIRGGCWLNFRSSCRASLRFGYASTDRYRNLGFRLARVPSGGK